MTMNVYLTGVLLGVLGLIIGSFVGASVWRLRLRQLQEDEAAGEEIDGDELQRLKPLAAKNTVDDRSRCLECGHVLHWYDLIPLFSWLTLRGKCRYCKKRIGWYEPVAEITMAVVFAGSFFLWPLGFDTALQWIQFGVWLVAMAMLGVLFIYDMKWFLLPDRVVFPFISTALVFAALRLSESADVMQAALSLAGAIVILSGLYYILHLVSRGQWIGFGDVKLGLGLALLMGEWQLAFIALFLANVLGLLVVLPGMMRGVVTQQTRIPFGPFLIVGTLITFFVGGLLLSWYESFPLLFLS